jgi:hypothetical protein
VSNEPKPVLGLALAYAPVLERQQLVELVDVGQV